MPLRLAEIQTEDGEHIISLRDEISQEELTVLYNSLKPTSEYTFMKHMHRIVILNGNELSSFIRNLSRNDRPLSKMDVENYLLEGNRLVANYCSFIGMFIDHLEKALSGSCKENRNDFRKYTSYLYDNKFEYRFFVMLRNFILHYSLPYTILNENLAGKRIRFSKNDILTFSGWKHVKKDIYIMDEEIDILPFIDPMNSYMSELLSIYLCLMAKNINYAYRSASAFVKKYNLRNPAIARYDSEDDLKKGHISISLIELSDLKSAMEDILNHPHKDIGTRNNPI